MLALIDDDELLRFCSVIEGTRAARLALVYPGVRRRLGENRWSGEIAAFHAESVIKSSRSNFVLDQFNNYLQQRFPGTVIADLAQYELGTYLLSIAPPRSAETLTTKSKQYPVLAPLARLLTLSGTTDDLLDDAAIGWNAVGGPAWAILYRTVEGSEVELLEISRELHALLAQCNGARALEALLEGVDCNSADVWEALETLTDFGVVEWR